MDNQNTEELYSLGTISEIARQSLKQLIKEQKPAVPPLYEKAFYRTAISMGNSDLVDHLMAKMPTGQAATVLIEKLAFMMNGLDENMKYYRQGIDVHSEQISDHQVKIKKLVAPETWDELEKHLTGVLEANDQMKQRVVEAEQRIQEQENNVSQLQHKIRFDPLTGALNRYALDEDISAEFSRSKRYIRPLSIVMADIDYFKKINDTYGHAAGDEVLKAFVMLVRKSLRDVDNVYRYGGEEFVIVLPETPGAGGVIAAERLRKNIEKHTLKHKTDSSLQILITASFGVASYTDGDPNYHSIIDRADAALYRAKNSGRNRVEQAF
jgi:diguanylate cyclase (GGDEF)-like protein